MGLFLYALLMGRTEKKGGKTMYRISIGEISKDRVKNWNLGDDNPYAVIKGKAMYSKTCDIYGIMDCQKYLRDKIQIDWGSWAFKADRKELEDLFKRRNWGFGLLDKRLENGKDYAVVFIEEV